MPIGTNVDPARVQAVYADTLSIELTAERLGISRHTVCRIVRPRATKWGRPPLAPRRKRAGA